MNLSIEEISGAVKAEILNGGKTKIKNIITDSREILEDCLFFALKGEVSDGHDFAEAAAAGGAAAVILNKGHIFENKTGAAVIAVEDTRQALLELAEYYKSLFKLEFTAAVTGSNGKTMVKELIYAVLSQKYKTRKSEGNLNTETGLSKTIFSLRPDERALVLEMGMDRFGEISKLSKTANPDIGIINNIGTAHIEKLGSKEGIKKAKFEILDGMGADSIIILNADDPFLYSEKGRTGLRECFFGINNSKADYTAGNISFDYAGNTAHFEIGGTGFKIPAVGIHNVYNALAAYTTGKLRGLTDERIQAGFDAFRPAAMRQNIYEINGITIIDDCYNASLESIRAALSVLADISGGKNKKNTAVLADVLECGDFAAEIHRQIGEAALEFNIDKIFVYGEKSKKIAEVINDSGRCVYFEDKTGIAKKLFEETGDGGTVLFKASRGMAMETVLEDFKKLF